MVRWTPLEEERSRGMGIASSAAAGALSAGLSGVTIAIGFAGAFAGSLLATAGPASFLAAGSGLGVTPGSGNGSGGAAEAIFSGSFLAGAMPGRGNGGGAVRSAEAGCAGAAAGASRAG